MVLPLSSAEQAAARAVKLGGPRGARNRTPPRFDAARLRELRDAKGLSRNDLAKLCPNVSYAAIRAYEEGRNKPDIDRALELASALKVPVRHLTT